MWPADPARAPGRARSRPRCTPASATLRNDMTMCIRERVDVRPWSPGARRGHRARRGRSGTSPAQRFGAGGDLPVRSVLDRRRVLSRPSRSASRPTACSPPARRARTWRRCWRIRSCASGSRPRWPRPTIIEADEPRVIYRDKLARGGPPRDGPAPRSWRPGSRAYAPRTTRARRCASAAAGPRTSTAGGSRATSFDTRVYAGIVDYEPTELVITARAGTSLAAIESATLAAQRADARVRAAALRRRRHARRRDRERAVRAAPALRRRRARPRAGRAGRGRARART